MGREKIFDDYQGASIKIGGVCYKWIGETTSSVNSSPSEIEEVFDNCLECAIESSSSESTQSSSSESIGNVSSSSSSNSSESEENVSSSSSEGCATVSILTIVGNVLGFESTSPLNTFSGFVCVNGNDIGEINVGLWIGISLVEPGAASKYSVGQVVEVCDDPCSTSSSSSSSYPEGDLFKALWDSGENKTVQIYIGNPNTTYIDWGDGNQQTVTGGFIIEHIYPDADTEYEMSVDFSSSSGWISGWGYASKLKEIRQWGTYQWPQMANAFSSCSGLEITASDVPDLSACSDCSWMFAGCTGMTGASANWNWDMNSVTDCSGMFNTCPLFNGAIQNFTNMGNVTTLANMLGATLASRGVFNQPIGVWDTSSVTDIQQAIRFQPNFDQDLSNWDVSNVTVIHEFMAEIARGTPYDALSTANYDALLISWGGQSLKPAAGIPTFGNSKYTAGGAAEAGRTAIGSEWGAVYDGGAV